MIQHDLFAPRPTLAPRRGDGVTQPLRVLFVLCNPSTADASIEDQTSRKGIGFCRRWAGGWVDGDHDPIVHRSAWITDCERYRYTLVREPATRRWGMVFVNLFGWRATDPRELWHAASRGEDVVGPENHAAITQEASSADRIVLAWGDAANFGPKAPRAFRGRDRAVLELLRGRELWCLGTTASGAPRHPRVLAYSTPLVRFEVPR